jgi:hypothetical protein
VNHESNLRPLDASRCILYATLTPFLSYLSLEGPQAHRHLAELSWQEGSLSMTLIRLRQGAGSIVEAGDKKLE